MYYLNVVRIITNNVDIKTLDTLKRHINKSGVNHGYLYVKELSDNNTLHAHAIIACESMEDIIALKIYIDKHHLKKYIDKCSIIPNFDQVKHYIAYMTKQLCVDSIKYNHYDYKDIKTLVWGDHNKKLYRILYGVKAGSVIINDDPFIDSDTNDIVKNV